MPSSYPELRGHGIFREPRANAIVYHYYRQVWDPLGRWGGWIEIFGLVNKHVATTISLSSSRFKHNTRSSWCSSALSFLATQQQLRSGRASGPRIQRFPPFRSIYTGKHSGRPSLHAHPTSTPPIFIQAVYIGHQIKNK